MAPYLDATIMSRIWTNLTGKACCSGVACLFSCGLAPKCGLGCRVGVLRYVSASQNSKNNAVCNKHMGGSKI